MKALVPYEVIEQRIFFLRSHKVMIDHDLAELFNVQTKNLNRQVRRNKDRFPKEFMFQLTKTEKNELVTNWHQFKSLKHSTVLPYAFTEHGVAMLASVLNSERAVKMSILIIKTFVKLREIISTHKKFSDKLKELEAKFDKHDNEIHAIVQALRELIEDKTLRDKPRKRIGYKQIGEK